jgi:hypothetical protein
MADVTRTAADRGQLILVAAFGVAVMLVALALILNTAIYTENLATRGSDISGGHDAIQYGDTTQRTLHETVRYVNYNNDSSYSELQTNVRWAVWNYSNASGRQQASDAIVTRTTVTDQKTGTRIHNRSGNFSDTSGNRNWTIDQSAGKVRNFTMEVDRNSIAGNDPPPVKSNDLFYVNLSDDDDNEYYRVYVYNNSTTGGDRGLNVTVQGQTDVGWNFERGCNREWPGETATVNITEATVAGERCKPLRKVANITDESDDFKIRFNNTMDTDPDPNETTIEGNYSMVVDSDIGATGSAAPTRSEAIYSVTVHLVYESKRLYFETDIRAAPGEFDD